MNNKNKEKNNKSNYILTKETLGMTLLLFSAIVLLMLFTHKAVFAGIGKAICTFMYGTFGYGSILLVGLLAYLGEWLVFGKKIKISFKFALAISLTVLSLFLLFHAVTTRNYELTGYGHYISYCYTNADKGYSGYTFGGVISALIVYPFAKLTTFSGAYVFFSLFVIASGYFLFTALRNKKPDVASDISDVTEAAEETPIEEQTAQPIIIQTITAESQQRAEAAAVKAQAVEQPSVQPAVQHVSAHEDPFSKKNLGRKILLEKGTFDAESYRRNLIFNEDSYFNNPVHNDSDYLNSFSSGKKSAAVPQQSYAESYQEDILNQPASTPSSYVYGDKPVDTLEDFEEISGGVYSVQTHSEREEVMPAVDYSETINEQANNFNQPVQTYETKREPIVANEYRPESRIEPKLDLGTENRVNEPVEEKPVKAESKKEPIVPERIERANVEQPEEEDKPVQDDSVNMFKLFGASSMPRENRIEPDVSRLSARRSERSKANIFDEDEDNSADDAFASLTRNSERSLAGKAERNDAGDTEDTAEILSEQSSENVLEELAKSQSENRLENRGLSAERKNTELKVRNVAPVQPPVQPPVQSVVEVPKQEEKPKHVWKKYVSPGLDLLDDYPEHSNVNTGEIEDNKRTIVETLGRFKIRSEVANVTIGPAITRYDVIIEDKTKIKQALNYKESIAMALMKENVNAYLNYSKGAVSIEVPNNSRTVVGLKSMLASQKFINSKSNSITFALGKNVEGEVVCPDITKMPHLLVAGTTGSGKSICLRSLIVSLLYKYGPEELRFILVDPKQSEFIIYDKLPHLMINEIIYDVDKAIKALNWAINEMERRYGIFKEMTEKGIATTNLDEYNSHLAEGEEKLPKIVIILDEFGDLMLQAKRDVESRIIRLVQKSRACGIHLILATQRPSVDCITGLIKSNLPTRIGFKVNSFDDSRTIFDVGGAEKLLGMGDMYFRSPASSELARIQGCFADISEVQKVTNFVKANNESYFDQSVSDFINKVEIEETSSSSGGEEGAVDGGDAKIDDTYIKALYYCVTSNQASVSMIQRRFPVGYIKACKIIDWMENMNYVTQSEGSKPRKVLLSKEEFINTYGEIDD